MSSKPSNKPVQIKIDYPTSADGYDVYQHIGKGAFAKVYPAKLKANKDTEVAIKVLDVSQDDPNWDAIKDEISTLRELQHENVIRVFTSFSECDTLWIVTPLLGAGSCADIMRRVRKTGFEDEAFIAALLHGALKALVYMHGLSKIHRDVKAGNILISNQGEVKLADFGVSGTMMQGGEMRECRTFTGSPCWMAPEVMEQSDGYDAKADMWSFGITAMELAFGRAPYSTFKPMKIILLTLQEDPPTIDIYEAKKKISKPLNQVITACLKKGPKERLSAADLIKKKLFRGTKPASYVAAKLQKLFEEDTTSRDLFAKEKKIPNFSETRSLEQVDKDKPVSFRTSFVFTADKNELRDIRMGRKQTFGSKTLGENDGDGDTGEEEKSKPNLELPKVKTTTRVEGRFQVEDVELEGKEPPLEGKQKKPDTTPHVEKIGRFTVQETSPKDGEQEQDEGEKPKTVVTTKGRFRVEEISTEPEKPKEEENIPPGAVKKGRFVVEDTTTQS